jgi:hypothetical protein
VPLYIIATKVKVRPAGAEVLHQAKLVANERYDLHDVSASCDDEGAVGRRGEGVDGALEVELALVFDLDEPRSAKIRNARIMKKDTKKEAQC